MRALYVRLTQREFDLLTSMAADERRDRPEQAAHLISEGLARYEAQKEFVLGLPVVDEDTLEAGVA
jgi:hypothetical protein